MRVLRNKSWRVLELTAEDGVLPQHIHSSSVFHPEHDVAAGTCILISHSWARPASSRLCFTIVGGAHVHWIHPHDVHVERLLQQSHQLTVTGVPNSSLVRQPLFREDACWTPQEFSPNKNCRTRIATLQWNNLYHHCEIYDPNNFERCPYVV